MSHQLSLMIIHVSEKVPIHTLGDRVVFAHGQSSASSASKLAFMSSADGSISFICLQLILIFKYTKRPAHATKRPFHRHAVLVFANEQVYGRIVTFSFHNLVNCRHIKIKFTVWLLPWPVPVDFLGAFSLRATTMRLKHQKSVSICKHYAKQYK